MAAVGGGWRRSAAVGGLKRAARLPQKATQQLWITYKLRRDGDSPEALAAASGCSCRLEGCPTFSLCVRKGGQIAAATG